MLGALGPFLGLTILLGGATLGTLLEILGPFLALSLSLFLALALVASVTAILLALALALGNRRRRPRPRPRPHGRSLVALVALVVLLQGTVSRLMHASCHCGCRQGSYATDEFHDSEKI